MQSSYGYQLRDFVALLRGEVPPAILPVDDAVAYMAGLDAIYVVGMSLRD